MKAVFTVESAALTFRKALTSRIGAAFFGLSPRHYEQNVAYLFPAKDIKVVLRAVKRAAPDGHSTASQAAAVARDAEVRMLALTHFSTRYPVGVLRGVSACARAALRPAGKVDLVYMPQRLDVVDDGRDVVPVGGDRCRAALERWGARRGNQARHEERLLGSREIAWIVHD